MAFVDLTGMKFGKLTVIGRADTRILRNGEKCGFWKCRCECGNEVEVRTSALKSGKTASCGAGIHHAGKNSPTYRHGGRKTKLYPVWHSMRQRCNNKNCTRYKDYGGRGISVCSEWSDFAVFMEWALSNGYADNLTLDRIDVNGNYCPENCRWITMFAQQHNRTNNVFLTHNGKTMILEDWGRETGIDSRLIHARIKKLGWSVEKALTTPVNKTKRSQNK